MAQPISPKFKSSAPLQAGLYYARKRTRLLRAATQEAIGPVEASPPNPDAEDGTEGDGKND